MCQFYYKVSGEYSLIKNGIKKIYKWRCYVRELDIFKRAGACAIITYFALDSKKIKIDYWK